MACIKKSNQVHSWQYDINLESTAAAVFILDDICSTWYAVIWRKVSPLPNDILEKSFLAFTVKLKQVKFLDVLIQRNFIRSRKFPLLLTFVSNHCCSFFSTTFYKLTRKSHLNQIGGDDLFPRGCGWSQKPGPDRVKQHLNITNINSNYQKNTWSIFLMKNLPLIRKLKTLLMSDFLNLDFRAQILIQGQISMISSMLCLQFFRYFDHLYKLSF